MPIRSPERGDHTEQGLNHAADDLHKRIDEKRKQIDRRRTSRRGSDRGLPPDVASDSAVADNPSETSAGFAGYQPAPRALGTPVREGPPQMAAQPKGAVERSADLIDVHILDMAAQIEALLRSVREIQENVLRVRGALPPVARQHPAAAVQSRLAGMLRECDALRDAVLAAAATAERLADPMRTRRRTE